MVVADDSKAIGDGRRSEKLSVMFKVGRLVGSPVGPL